VPDALLDALRGGYIGHFVGGLTAEDRQLLLDIRLQDDRCADGIFPGSKTDVLPL
jgi:hypothetical protein